MASKASKEPEPNDANEPSADRGPAEAKGVLFTAEVAVTVALVELVAARTAR